jgi:uncharacterized protein (DUF305 family)
MSKLLTVSLVIIAFMIGVGFGHVISPQYAQMNDRDAEMVDLGRADKYVDLRYINAMIAHHRGAMQLADQVKDQTKRPEIKALAESIIKDEPKNIDELYAFKKEFYKDDSRVADKKVANLGTYDEKLDLRLLNALIAHHNEGLMMNKEIRVKSTRNEILSSADATDEFFTRTLAIFKQWRAEWYSASDAPAAKDQGSNGQI